jgi:hypothetical protein
MAIASGSIIDDQDVYNRVNSVISSYANSGIVYGTNNYHFSDMPAEFKTAYEGTTSGIPLSNYGNFSGQIIEARAGGTNPIVDYIMVVGIVYCRIRKVAVKRIVTASNGKLPTDETRTGVSYMKDTYASYYSNGFPEPSSGSNISSGNVIRASDLINFIDAVKNQYANLRDVVFEAEYSVCHNSCHQSCHGSRGRR